VYILYTQQKKKKHLTNPESDGLIGLPIVAVYGAVSRRLGRDPAEPDRPRRVCALVHR
jgi:hypothetical protein